MRLPDSLHLLDLNVLIALTSEDHIHHAKAKQWLESGNTKKRWCLCPFTEAGYVRVVTNPRSSACTVAQAVTVLKELAQWPGYCYWPVADTWVDLVAPFAERIFGHQQVTDAYLLGLAIKTSGVLVTFDKALLFLAGPEYAKNLLLLESRPSYVESGWRP